MITIRSAAELDALPVGSVVRCDDAEGIGLNVCERHREGWQYVGSALHFSSAQVASDELEFTVLYRPDAPARTEPTEEQVAWAIASIYGETCAWGREKGKVCGLCDCNGMTEAYARQAARAVLALVSWPRPTEDLLDELDAAARGEQ